MHIRYYFCLFLFLFSATLVSAHATGVSYEERKDGYKIDIGHEDYIMADTPTRFDFAAYKENSTSSDDVYTDVWVTVTRDNQIIFAGGISKPVFGATGFTTVFPHEGTYTVSARFQKNGEAVVKTEFQITVNLLPVVQKSKLDIVLVSVAVITLAFGIISGYFLGYRHKSRKI